jgi:hypothetical protein
MAMPIVSTYPGSTALAETRSCGPPANDTQSVPDGIKGNASVCDALRTLGNTRRRSSARA